MILTKWWLKSYHSFEAAENIKEKVFDEFNIDEKTCERDLKKKGFKIWKRVQELTVISHKKYISQIDTKERNEERRMRKETLKKYVKNPIENDELRSDLNAVLKRKKTKNKLKIGGAFKLGLKSTVQTD